MIIDKTSLSILRKSIGFGGITGLHDLARKKGIDISYQHIRNVLQGYVYRQDIIDLAFEYVELEKKEQEKINEAIKKKIQKIAT